mmetsp:Transcript_21188/g.27888  ORF Transcript_21188/g.27888 Transcript_21188/m.27888 type:complete len:85 (-) Transcript_21188:640-894(-)
MVSAKNIQMFLIISSLTLETPSRLDWHVPYPFAAADVAAAVCPPAAAVLGGAYPLSPSSSLHTYAQTIQPKKSLMAKAECQLFY